MKKRGIKGIMLVLFLFIFVTGVQAATLTCQQISSSSMSVPQFSNSEIEIRCTASGGSVNNVQMSPNPDPSSGLTITNTQTISSTITDQETSTAKWRITGDSPNDYTVSYSLSSDGTESWTGPSTTLVGVTSPAQLSVDYITPPSTYSEGAILNYQITNIGGTPADNIKVKLNSGSLTSFDGTIEGGSSASGIWTESTGFDAAGTYVTYVYIGDTLHNSVVTIVSSGGAICGNSIVETGEECDDGNTDSDDGCSSTCQDEDSGTSPSGGGSGGLPPIATNETNETVTEETVPSGETPTSESDSEDSTVDTEQTSGDGTTAVEGEDTSTSEQEDSTQEGKVGLGSLWGWIVIGAIFMALAAYYYWHDIKKHKESQQAAKESDSNQDDTEKTNKP